METEVKIRVSSFAPIRLKVKAAGGLVTSKRTFEQNTLLDVAEGSLRAAGKSFRVRRYGDSGSVTLKGVARVSGGLKSRQELETEVSSPEMLMRILGDIGFRPQFRYEKFREVWKLGRCVLCLDETPLGRFVEIEGTERGIRSTALLLGLGASRFLSDSYPVLWFKAGRHGDMVFAGKRKERRA